jgi:hypothetical protein
MNRFVTVTSEHTRRRFKIGGYYKINYSFGRDFIRIVADETHGCQIQRVALSRYSVPEIVMDCKENLLSPYGETVKSERGEYEKAFDIAVSAARKLQIPEMI